MLAELFLSFAKISASTFGGGYAMIPLLEDECVEKKGWITSEEFIELTVIAESTPGPIAINAATYTGYKMAGIAGSVSATAGMVLPPFFIIFLISGILEKALRIPLVQGAFRGIRVAVAFLIIRAALIMFRKQKLLDPGNRIQFIFFLAAVIVMCAGMITGNTVSPILVIIAAGILGLVVFGGRGRRQG